MKFSHNVLRGGPFLLAGLFSAWLSVTFRSTILVIFILFFMSDDGIAKQGVQETAAEFSLKGMGWMENRRLNRTLRIMAEDDRGGNTYTASFVEDSVLILLDYLKGKGYLNPQVRVRAKHSDGSLLDRVWETPFESNLPRSARFEKVRFRLIPGLRFYYEEAGIAGAGDISTESSFSYERIQSYFYADGFLFRRRHSRVFTPGRFHQGIQNLREVLRRQGYRDAQVTGQVLDQDLETGAVRTVVNIEAGSRYQIRSLMVETSPGNEHHDMPELLSEHDMQFWSRIWEQDTLLRIRNNFYALGYADVQCVMHAVHIEEAVDGVRQVDLGVTVERGPGVSVGEIRLEGRQHTRESAMWRRFSFKPGDPLNPLAAEQVRQRLAAMGSFRRVSLRYEPVEDSVRNLIYTVEEGNRLEVALLAGYGSYELLRGGLEIEQFNLWGRGHRSRLLLIQSLKSTEADYLYSIPVFLGERLSGFSRISALRRDEIDFLRRETGIESGVRQSFPKLGLDASLRYSYAFVESSRSDAVAAVGIADAKVGALSVDLRRDRRDNPVSPEQGGQLFTRAEMAMKVLGGEAEYMLWEIGASRHWRIGGGRFWHTGLQHGIINALGDEVDTLPFNKRFFPGGDRSIRGYRYGEGASVNASGQLIGSEFYGLLQNEIEQALTPAWRVLLFADVLQIGADLDNYPHGDLLISAGVGVRLQTIVGPLRMEYGHNLRRRDADPKGTFHVSVGFPF